MSDRSPLVSVVVPAYNAERFIRHALDALLAQTYRPLEIAVVDDGSTDATASEVERFAEEQTADPGFSLRLLRQPNGGRGAARAAGVGAVTGEFVGFVDADDDVAPTFYERLVAEACETPDTDVVVARYQNTGRDGVPGHVYEEGAEAHYGGSLDEEPRLIDEVEASLCNKLFRRSLFSEDIGFPVGLDFEDLATTYRLMARARTIRKVVSEPLYFYRQGGPVSVMAACDHRYNDLVDAVATNIDFFRREGRLDAFRPQLVRLALRHLVFARFGDFFVTNQPRVLWPYLDRVYRLLDDELPGWRESAAFSAMCGSRWSKLLVSHKALLKAYVALRGLGGPSA